MVNRNFACLLIAYLSGITLVMSKLSHFKQARDETINRVLRGNISSQIDAHKFSSLYNTTTIRPINVETHLYKSRAPVAPSKVESSSISSMIYSNTKTTSTPLSGSGSSSNSSTPKSQRHLNTQISARNLMQSEALDDYRVPLWNIAHMINSIDQIGPALSSGANGIEVDITFNREGTPTEAYHGFPCDCGRHCHHREIFIKFVQHLAKISTQSEESGLQLVIFDLKLKDLGLTEKELAGKHLAMILHQNLYDPYFRATKNTDGHHQQPPIRVVVSINHVTDNILVRSFLNYLSEYRLDNMRALIGFDVGMNDNLNDINAMWNGFNGATPNIWQGDGLTNCANLIRGSDRLKEAISIRNGQGHFKKIYYWTADVMYQIRSVLRFGLDAILTNQPRRVVQVLNEPEFVAKYRLATPYDDPFAQFWIKPSAWKMLPPSIGEAVETVSNIHRTSTNFVRTLPDGIAAAIKKVHNSIILK